MSPGRDLTSMTVPALLGFEASIVGELRQLDRQCPAP